VICGVPQRTFPLLLPLLLAACARAPSTPAPARLDPAAFSGERALYEAHALVAVGPRVATTEGARRAAAHLRDRLQLHGVEAEIDTFADRTPQGRQPFCNVIGRLPGKQPGLILLGSHFDTKAGVGATFQGANDSASSSGALLELARVLAASGWAGPELQFVFFDGEEALHNYGASDGLHGSRHHANRLVRERRAGQVLGVIVLDMIGDRDLNVTIPRNGAPALAARVLRAAQAEGVRHRFALYPYEIGDDHEPFLKAGMPAVDLIDFTFGSAPERNDYWHTLDDTVDKLSGESLATVGRVVLRLLNDWAIERATDQEKGKGGGSAAAARRDASQPPSRATGKTPA